MALKVDGDWGCGDGCGVGDTRQWTANSLYDIQCKKCNTKVEFFKDDKKHKCPSCGEMIFNEKYGQDCC